MARIVNCPRGHTLTGKDDAGLFSLAKQRVKEHHPDSSRGGDVIRQLLARMAHHA
jgi:hypothetical protein